MTKVDMAVVNWIKENVNVTHADLPLEYVRDWARRTSYDGRVHQYAVFGYLQASLADGKGTNEINTGMASFLEEFEAKLSLRLFQELAGVEVKGFPMFKIVGRETLAEIFLTAPAPLATIIRQVR